MSHQDSLFRLIIGFLVTTGFAVGGGYLWVSQNDDIESYNSVDATVIDSEVTTTRKGREGYHITYEYTVDGRTYESSNVFPGPGEAPADDPDQLVSEYPEGEEVTAYYDPQDPSKSFLVSKRNVLFPVLMIGVGLLGMFVSGRTIVRRLKGVAS